MTDRQAQATAYAADYIKRLSNILTPEQEELAFYVARDSYEQGWVDCDHKCLNDICTNRIPVPDNTCWYVREDGFCDKEYPNVSTEDATI